MLKYQAWCRSKVKAVRGSRDPFRAGLVQRAGLKRPSLKAFYGNKPARGTAIHWWRRRPSGEELLPLSGPTSGVCDFNRTKECITRR